MIARRLRRSAWRVGRRLYAEARGEPRTAGIRDNGEAHVQRRVVAALRHLETFRALDIGANQGEWTLSLLAEASAAGASGHLRIDCFEPVASTAERLEAAVSATSQRGVVTVHRQAISDQPGRARMAVMSTAGGTNTLHPDGLAGEPAGGWRDVSLDTLDSFCTAQGIAHIHLAKCDTEGHDLRVLTGARPLLVAGRIDVFQFEYNHRWILGRAFLRDVFELIAGLDYKVAKVGRGGRIDVYDGWHPELERFFEANYLLVRTPALNWFDVTHGVFDVSNTYA